MKPRNSPSFSLPAWLQRFSRRMFSLGAAFPVGVLLFPLALAGVDPALDCPEVRELCLRADRAAEIDLEGGTAELEGNVRGYIKSDDLSFRAGTTKAFQDENEEWVRLVLHLDVQLTRPNQKAGADHSILERDRARLIGNARFEGDGDLVNGDEILLEDKGERATIKGREGMPLLIQFKAKKKKEKGPPTPPPGKEEAPALETPTSIEVHATRGVFERETGHIELSGEVTVNQTNPSLEMVGNLVRLEVDKERNLTAFRAEGGVKIRQPGRQLEADLALSQDKMDKILLLGNAKIQQDGQFNVASDRVEVFTDVEKGIVGGQKEGSHATLSFQTEEHKTYLLNRNRFNALRSQNIPRETLNKLTPVLERTFPDRESLQEAVTEVLTVQEAERYLETILNQAKQ